LVLVGIKARNSASSRGAALLQMRLMANAFVALTVSRTQVIAVATCDVVAVVDSMTKRIVMLRVRLVIGSHEKDALASRAYVGKGFVGHASINGAAVGETASRKRTFRRYRTARGEETLARVGMGAAGPSNRS
jgi:hypothetical protein